MEKLRRKVWSRRTPLEVGACLLEGMPQKCQGAQRDFRSSQASWWDAFLQAPSALWGQVQRRWEVDIN